MKTKKEKVLSRVNKIVATVSMTAMMVTNPVYCTGILNGKPEDIGIDLGGISNGSEIFSRVISIICAVIAVSGALSLVDGFAKYMEAKQDDNTAQMSKAGRSMAIGAIMVAAPLIVQFVLTGTT